MLVLTRKEHESIYIYCGDEKIEVMLVSANHRSAKIGITADKKVTILRDNVKKRTN